MLLPRIFTVAMLILLLPLAAHAANQPCSGKKGGVERCDGELFVCNDGSISASKRNCAAERGAAAAPMPLQLSGDCPCGSGNICVGPRGGRYCLTPSGNKSYLRR